MTCAFCDNPVAEDLIVTFDEAALLCYAHLAKLIRHRQKPRCAKCAGLLYLLHCADDSPRTICARCVLNLPPTVDMSTSVLPVPIRRGRDNA